MRFRIMRFSIYAVLENGPNSCFMLQYSHIMRFLFKIIVYKILLIFFLHLCYSCIMRFLLGNKKRINGELSYMLTIHTPGWATSYISIMWFEVSYTTMWPFVHTWPITHDIFIQWTTFSLMPACMIMIHTQIMTNFMSYQL